MSHRALHGTAVALGAPACPAAVVPQKPMAIMARRLCPARWVFRREGMEAGTTRGRSQRRAWYTVAWPQGRAASAHCDISAPPSDRSPHGCSLCVWLWALSVCGFAAVTSLAGALGAHAFSTDHWGAETRHLKPDVHSPGTRHTQKMARTHLTIRTRM